MSALVELTIPQLTGPIVEDPTPKPTSSNPSPTPPRPSTTPRLPEPAPNPTQKVNDPADVKIIQHLLNTTLDNDAILATLRAPASLPGFIPIPEDGKVTPQFNQMVFTYQRLAGVASKAKRPDEIRIDPGDATLRALVRGNRFADPRWNEYDTVIQETVDYYNKKFATNASYVPLDWQLVKAMVWTECADGPGSSDWKNRPMQIGNPHDPGLVVLRDGGENSDLVTDPAFRQELNQPVTGHLNIRAGIAWLMREAIAHTTRISVVDNKAVMTYTTAQHDTLAGIAKHLNTTQEELATQNNLTAAQQNSLSVGLALKYRTAHHERQIDQWQKWEKAVVDYNGKGDQAYHDKVFTAYDKIKAAR